MSCIRNTNKTDEWIRQNVAKWNIKQGESNGKPNGIFDTLVRINYASVVKPKINKLAPEKDPKFSAELLFTPFHDLRPLLGAAMEMIAHEKKASLETVASTLIPGRVPDKIMGVRTPFHDQAERANKEGYTPGCAFMRASADMLHRPRVMRRKNGINIPVMPDEEELIYSGMWAVVTFNLFTNQAVPAKQIPFGVNAGLLGVFLYAGDERLGAKGLDDSHYASIEGEDFGSSGFESADQGGIPGAGTPGFSWESPAGQPEESVTEKLRRMGL
jgi:hypothetical protein